MGLLSNLLGVLSGNNNLKVSEQLLFDKVIGFKSIVPGCGASTLLQNVAIALSENTKFNICVLDTNFMFPIQYPLLFTGEMKDGEDDLLDFTGDLSKITRNTSYTNVYVVELHNRNIVDLLSGKDSENNIVKLMANLKSYFDVILVDISSEPSNIAIHSAIKCNRIIQVADTSFKCLYNIKKSLNNSVTLGVPLAKSNSVVLNKELKDVVLGVETALEEAGLRVLGKIPLSMDIAVSCAKGARIVGSVTKDPGTVQFNKVIDTILQELLEKSPLNSEYMDVSKELERIENEQKKKKELNNEELNIVDTDEDIEDDIIYEGDVAVDELSDSEGVDNA